MAPQLRDHDRYDILGEHGRGGLGRVSRAHDRELGRDIAIKELISRGHVSEVRFLREALITARLEHPGIVPVYEAGRWSDGTPFYAMKLVAGRPLRDLIAERKTVDERIGLLHHVIAVADAIAYAHGRNIIHRDLKPANVIVGDFGETVVIDWGLAKDLTAAEESTVGGGPFRVNRDDGLTSAGSVLGTLAYMPPEQERGEPVDQRADVFAIGAMLWELCSLHKLPPSYAGQRRHLLRRAGIDQDLIAIIEKAVDADPARRYPDAGALAADLKAFKAGARIAARRYSPWALLSHWTRRHRMLALSAATALGVASAVGVLYVRGIAAERDRTDTALRRVEATKNDLVLEHAALLLHSDPTAALAALDGYRGGDATRRSELLAEAYGRGVARSVVHPHNDTVWFLAGQPDGSFISIGEDHRIRRTLGTSTTSLASNVSYTVRFAYAPTRRLLAYAASPTGVALLDLMSGRAVVLRANSPVSIRFTPDGSQLAALDKQGTVIVWSTSPTPVEIYRGVFPGATILLLPRPSTLLLVEGSRLRSLNIPEANSVTWDHLVTAIDANERDIAAGLSDGTLSVLSRDLHTTASVRACKQRVKAVTLVPQRDLIAFGCEEGIVGVARYSPSEHVAAVIDTLGIKTDPWLLVADSSGTNLLTISDRTTYIYNIATRLITRLEGQANAISALAAPSPGFPYVLVGDVNGTVRRWDPPAPSARVIAKAPDPFAARFSPDGTILAVFGADPAIRLIRLSDASTVELHGHSEMIGGVRFSHDGLSLLSFSWDGTARIWRTSDGSALRTFSGHHAIVEDGCFTQNDERVVTIGDDGRLFAWRAEADDATPLLAHEAPLISVETLATTNDLVTRDSSGALWVVALDGRVRQIRRGTGVAATSMRASTDGKLFAIGHEDGGVTVYRTADWTILTSFTMKGTIARITFDPQGRDMLIQSEDGVVRLNALDGRRRATWQDFQVEAHDIAYDPTGDIIAISAVDGGSWFYSIRRASWVYLQDHMTELSYGHFSPDGSQFVSIDEAGAIVTRDASTIFDHLAKTH